MQRKKIRLSGKSGGLELKEDSAAGVAREGRSECTQGFGWRPYSVC